MVSITPGAVSASASTAALVGGLDPDLQVNLCSFYRAPQTVVESRLTCVNACGQAGESLVVVVSFWDDFGNRAPASSVAAG
eukprot:scaffold487650_cov18-Prasinocladus_malaysianus.AAC.1